jgi:DNA-binding SARP family transcriptional activator/tetratricopeptide (TPR) repeat protein
VASARAGDRWYGSRVTGGVGMEFLLLGPLEVRDGDRALPIVGARQRGLLAVLLLHANEVVSTDRLIEDVWRGEPPDTADNALQRQVSRLRHVLQPADGTGQPLLTRAPGYVLNISPDALDLERFRRIVDEARRARGIDPSAAASLLRQALALWRGQPLADFAFEPFAQVEVARLEEMRIAALEDLAEADLAAGAHDALVAEIEALVAEHPLRERLRGHLMLALYRSGRQADALRVYREGRTTLVEELGIEPGPELRALEKAILVHDAALILAPPARTARRVVSLALGDRVMCPILVGRSEPFALLVSALGRARAGDGRVAVLSGDAGAGKTRLARELAEHAAAEGLTVLAGACSETELSLPYLPLVEAIGGGLADADPHQLRAALGPAATELGALFPQLAAGAPSAAPPARAEQAKLRLFEAMVSLLLTLSTDAGLLLVLDDMQWAEGSTLELTEYLARRLRSSRTLLLLTLRTAEVDRSHPLMVSFERWQRSGRADLIEVTPLDHVDVTDMVEAILGPNTSAPNLGEVLHARSDGNPYVVEELLKDALDHGDLIRTKEDAWESRPSGELRLPRSVADNVLRRVDRLGDEHAEALRAAAVLGRTFSFPALLTLVGRPEQAVRGALDHCVRRQLLDEDDRGDTYRFRHALTWEAVYTDLLPSRRRRLHAHAADALRALPGQPPVAIAHHLLEGGRGQEAVEVCIAAAAEATRHHAHADAAQLYARAFEHAGDDGTRGRLLCLWGEAGHRAGDAASAEERLERGVALLVQHGDHLEAARHRLSLGRCCWERSQHQRARREYELARQALEVSGPSPELATAYVRLSSLHTYQLEYDDAEELAVRAADIAELVDSASARVAAALWLGSAQCDQGHLDEGLVHLRRAFDEATALELHDLAAQALSNTLSVLESYGRVAECGLLLELYRERRPDPWTEMMAAYYAGWLHLWAAELETAAAAIEHLNRLADQYGTRTPLSWGRGVLSVILSELGRFDEAWPLVPTLDDDLERQELAEQWWEILRFRLATQDVAGALEVAERVLPSAWWAAGTALPDAAVEALLAAGREDDAGRLVDDVGAQPRGRMNTAHLHRSRGRLALARGDSAAATHHLADAVDGFRVGGYRLEVLRTQLVQAQSLANDGKPAEAAAAIRQLVADSTSCGAATIAASAGAMMRAM